MHRSRSSSQYNEGSATETIWHMGQQHRATWESATLYNVGVGSTALCNTVVSNAAAQNGDRTAQHSTAATIPVRSRW